MMIICHGSSQCTHAHTQTAQQLCQDRKGPTELQRGSLPSSAAAMKMQAATMSKSCGTMLNSTAQHQRRPSHTPSAVQGKQEDAEVCIQADHACQHTLRMQAASGLT